MDKVKLFHSLRLIMKNVQLLLNFNQDHGTDMSNWLEDGRDLTNKSIRRN